MTSSLPSFPLDNWKLRGTGNQLSEGKKNVCLIVLGFNDTSTLVGHFVSSPREREKSYRRYSRGDERRTGKKVKKQKK